MHSDTGNLILAIGYDATKAALFMFACLLLVLVLGRLCNLNLIQNAHG